MWATWCTPCQIQMLELKKTYDNYDRDELEILSIDIDQRETVYLVNNFLDAYKEQLNIELNWIFGMDDSSIWEKYILNGSIPTLYIFSQNGTIYYSHEGAIYFEMQEGWPDDTVTLKSKIDELLV